MRFKYLKCLQRCRGFTLLEVVIAMVLCVLTLITILAANSMLTKSNVLTHQRVVAMQDAQQVIERVRDSGTVGVFPANVMNTFVNGAQVAGFNNLPNEQIRLNYLVVGTELLDVSITINWLDETNHNMTYRMGALVTQRE